MAINDAPMEGISVPNPAAAARNFEHRFFFAVAVLFPLAILIGFAPTFYLKPLFNTPPIPRTIVYVHAFVMAAWIVLFITQVYLISAKRILVHRKLGFLGVVLGLAIIVSGLMTAIAATKYGAAAAPKDIPRLDFMIVPFGDLVVFAILFAAAVYYRKQAATHKRLILLTVINFLPPALARYPGGVMDKFGPLWFFGIPTILTLFVLIGDTWKHQKLNKVFLMGGIFMIAAWWLRLPLSSTDAWRNFAAWMISF